MRLVIRARVFRHLLKELKRRGQATRESGAFLLGESTGPAIHQQGTVRIIAAAFYDDLDPHSLTGGITFGADGYTALAELCRAEHLVVVGDVHTHPSRSVRQSSIDARNPMVAIPGHLAIIVPNFAAGRINTRDVGVHEFRGAGEWASTFGFDVDQVLVIQHSICSPRRVAARVSRVLRRGRDRQRTSRV